MDPPEPVYDDLLSIVKDKDYFVITTNVDQCFQKAGFDKERLFYTQGDYGLFQCSLPCHPQTYDNRSVIRQMIENQSNMRTPTELVPHCPRCGRPMTCLLYTSQLRRYSQNCRRFSCGRRQYQPQGCFRKSCRSFRPGFDQCKSYRNVHRRKYYCRWPGRSGCRYCQCSRDDHLLYRSGWFRRT